MKYVQWTCGGGRALPGECRNRLRMVGRFSDGAVVVADCVEQPGGWAVSLRVNDAPAGEVQTNQAHLGDALRAAVEPLLVAA